MESNIVDFSKAANLQWEADFKKRWKAKNEGAGEFTSDIWSWQEMLEHDGWIVQFYDNIMPEFSAFVNFDKKLLTANIPKAYHMQKTMSAMLDVLFAGGATGRHLYEWKEVHDDAHRHVRDGDEWKDDKEYYMSVWYSMELYVREMTPEEDIPVAPKEIREPVSKLLNTLEPLTPLVE